MIIERLGDPEKARIPRPIRVKLENAKSRNEICAYAKVLKHKERVWKGLRKKGRSSRNTNRKRENS